MGRDGAVTVAGRDEVALDGHFALRELHLVSALLGEAVHIVQDARWTELFRLPRIAVMIECESWTYVSKQRSTRVQDFGRQWRVLAHDVVLQNLIGRQYLALAI